MRPPPAATVSMLMTTCMLAQTSVSVCKRKTRYACKCMQPALQLVWLNLLLACLLAGVQLGWSPLGWPQTCCWMDSTGRCLHPTCGLWVSLGLLLTRGKQPDEHHRLQHTAENVQELQLGIHDLTCTPGHQACAQYLMDLTCDDDSVNYRDQVSYAGS